MIYDTIHIRSIVDDFGVKYTNKDNNTYNKYMKNTTKWQRIGTVDST